MSASSIGTIAGGALGFATGGPVGAAIGAGIGGSVGGSYEATQAQNKANDMMKSQLAFNEQQYQDWQRIFGPVEQNLSEYYQNLDPEGYAATIKNNLEAQYDTANQRVNTTLAQRHIDDSGMTVALNKDLNQSLAQQKAIASNQAKDIVEQKKLGFLGVGLGNQNAVNANINASYQNAAMFNANYANNLQNMANQSLAGTAMFAGQYFGHNQPNGYNFYQRQMIK